ncbi:MAG: flagellar assembly peptidoglycan hydrolase FlgJ [Rhodocyclaceae bacterium]|nr:flagellar assembly peptidoglycan hydrolase FlgJ [Rhodocyclaceae bacterium]
MNPASAIPSIFDTQSLAALKQRAGGSDPQALKAAAQQFEALFLQMVLKSMRAATPQSGPFESEQTRFYQELLDAQLAQVLATRGGTGLAALIERQLTRTANDAQGDEAAALPLLPPPRRFPLEGGARALPLPKAEGQPALPVERVPQRPAAGAEGTLPAFVASVWPYAIEASRETGIPARFLVAHAALESGWGRFEPRHADGRPSHNLFGIKAGAGWSGAVVEAATTEYVNGVAEKRIERFRAYGSYAEAFRDYARLLAQSPRYAGLIGVQEARDFAQGLARAGYATDPDYAAKLERIIARLA